MKKLMCCILCFREGNENDFTHARFLKFLKLGFVIQPSCSIKPLDIR